MTVHISVAGLVLFVIIMAAPELLVLPFAVIGALWEVLCNIVTGKREEP